MDIGKSGTRREELLLSQDELEGVLKMRRAISNQGTTDTTENLLNLLISTKDNKEFVERLKKD